MPYRVEFTARAVRDLNRLYEYIHAAGVPAAALWFNNLEAHILRLENAPRLGAPSRDHPGIRQLIHGTRPHLYRVLYRIDDDARLVLILHMRHGRRDKIRTNNF